MVLSSTGGYIKIWYHGVQIILTNVMPGLMDLNVNVFPWVDTKLRYFSLYFALKSTSGM